MIKYFYSLLALELFVGGGGRMFELGPATLRMAFFSISLIASVLLLLKQRSAYSGFLLALLLVLGLIATHLPALFVGLMKGNAPEDIFSDLSPILYWLVAPFFAIILECDSMVIRTAQLIQFAAIVLAIGYLVVVVMIILGGMDFNEFYDWAAETTEIFFRNSTMFFYKGFIFLGIGSIFLIALGGVWRGAWLSIVLIALTLTLTRGFILSTALAGMFLLWTMDRKRGLLVGFFVIAVAVFVVWMYIPSLDDGYISGQRDISNSIRLDDISFMLQNFSIWTISVGEGFGSHINDRLAIENSYLTILWKMGPIALFFWTLPFGISLYYFRRIKRDSMRYRMGCAFFFGILLMYIQTATNPFLNNPIGLSFVMMAMFSLRTLSKTTLVSVNKSDVLVP